MTVTVDCSSFLLLPKSIFGFDGSCNKILPAGEACPNPVRWLAEVLQLLMCRQGAWDLRSVHAVKIGNA